MIQLNLRTTHNDTKRGTTRKAITRVMARGVRATMHDISTPGDTIGRHGTRSGQSL